MKVCKCEVCLYYTKVLQHLERLPDDLRPFFEDMYERLCHAEFDAQWNRAQAIEARSAMTAGHGPKDESAVAEGDAPKQGE